MRTRVLQLLFVALILSGCGTLTDSRKSDRLETTLSRYGSALRWGYYESAFSVRDPEQPRTPLPDMKNVRITSYEVAQPPVMEDDNTAVQVVRIEWVRDDVQRVQVYFDNQRWRYDPERKTWWLASPLPPFG